MDAWSRAVEDCLRSFPMVLEGDWALDQHCEQPYCMTNRWVLTVHTHTVPTIQLAEGIAFVRADDPKLFQKSEEPPLAEDSTSGPECPDLELFVSPMGYNTLTPDLFKETAFGVHAVALRPTSLGTVRLTSNDPFDGPVIDPKFVSRVLMLVPDTEA